MNSDDEEEEDDTPIIPSPTRQKPSKSNPFNKFGAARPPLISQRTAPISKQESNPNIFSKAVTAPSIPTLGSVPDLRCQPSNAALRERSTSPNRRLVIVNLSFNSLTLLSHANDSQSKIPSSANLGSQENAPTSPTRKSSLNKGKSGNDDLNKLALKNTMAKANTGIVGAPRGKTLVELAQARAGGRTVVIADGTRSPEPKGRAFAARMAEKNNKDTTAPLWDPETDEMPSPFIKRSRNVIR